MEMHQLRYFVAVAQAQSFSRAAAACLVSQPSLSQQIAKLEAEVGRCLFDRLGRRVQLTDAGRQLLDSAQAILELAEDARQRLQDDGNLVGCRLTVGAIPTIAPYLLPSVVERFTQRHAGVELTIHEDVTRNLLAAVNAAELDLAIIAGPVEDERLVHEALWTEPLLLALPRRHPLLRKKTIRLADLSTERFLVLSELHCLAEQVVSYCRAHECSPRIVCRSAQIPTMQAFIEQGLGVTLLPEMAVRHDTGNAVVYRPLAGDGPSRTITVVWGKRRYHSNAAIRFLDLLRAARA